MLEVFCHPLHRLPGCVRRSAILLKPHGFHVFAMLAVSTSPELVQHSLIAPLIHRHCSDGLLKPEWSDDSPAAESTPHGDLAAVQRLLVNRVWLIAGPNSIVLGVDGAVQIKMGFIRKPDVVGKVGISHDFA